MNNNDNNDNNDNNKLSILFLLFDFSPKLLIFSVSIGAVAGFLYSLIIPFAIRGIEGKGQSLTEMVDPVSTDIPFIF